MEMERINENTIRVLIGNDDLQARGITVLDLLGNHKQIENFFYSVLEEVDTDHQFQDTDSVTFQVLPTRNGLELFISKNNKGVDTKQLLNDESQLNNEQPHKATQANKPANGQASNEGLTNSLKKALRGHDNAPSADDYQKMVAQQQNNQGTDGEQSNNHLSVPAGSMTKVVEATDFDDMIRIAELVHSDGVKSDLYQYNHKYYLVLKFFDDNDHTPGSIADTMAVIYEYSNRSHQTADFLAEHGKKLMEQSALELLRYYFK